MNTENKIIYSGFWRRAGANLLDQTFCLLMVLPFMITVFFMHDSVTYSDISLSYLLFLFCVAILISTLYYTLQHSSKHQATFGMRIIGLKIHTTTMQKIGFWRSFFRTIVFNIISALYFLPWISLLTIVFLQKKQALHDLVCRTVITLEEQN